MNKTNSPLASLGVFWAYFIVLGFLCHNCYGGGGLPYESDGDARRKIRIKPLKETNLGVAQALFDP